MPAVLKSPAEAFSVFSKNETLHNKTMFLNHWFKSQERVLYTLHSELQNSIPQDVVVKS